MRARNWILGLAASAAAAVGAMGAGCGGSSDSTGGADASVDVTTDHAIDTAPDTTPDVQDAGMACMVDADLTQIHIDAGSDGGACVACVTSHCQQVLMDCNADCQCKGAFLDFLDCTGMGGSLQSCGQSTLAGVDPAILQGFIGCAPACATTCGVMLPDGGRDGGRDGASDAPADAPGDGG
jgi:hypothetical protein